MKAELDSIPRGMSIRACLALGHLAQNGPCRISDVAASVGSSTAAMTGIADRLESLGMATRYRHEHDRRIIMLDVTGNGQRIAEEIFAA